MRPLRRTTTRKNHSPIARRELSAALLALVGVLSTLGCPKAKPEAPAPSGWRTIKPDTYANGDLFVYVRSQKRDLDRGLPGVAFGDRRGPRFGLLGGYYAPQIIALDSGIDYDATADVQADSLSVTLSAEDTPGLTVKIQTPERGRVRVSMIGDAIVVPRADRTTVRGYFADTPSFGMDITAGELPDLIVPRATIVEVDVAEDDTWRIDTACPRVRLLKPRPTGSTSVFLVGVGPRASLRDEVYAMTGPAPPPHADFAKCEHAATSTFTFAWPARGR